MPWPGVYTIFPVLATFLVLVANYNDFHAIRHEGVQFTGNISYSLYLWHWPVYVIAQYYGVGTDLEAAAVFTLISVILGYISFRYIETLRFSSSKIIVAAMVIVFALTSTLSHFNSNHWLFEDKVLEIAGYESTHREEREKQYNKGICHVSSMEDYDKDHCLCIVKGEKNILLIGDSHMGQLSQSLRERFAENKNNIHFLQATASGTLPTVKNYEGKEAMVRELMDYTFLNFIPENARKIDGAIITASWAGKPSVEQDSILFGLREAVKYLEGYGISTIVIGQTERFTLPYPVVAARDYEDGANTLLAYIDSSAYRMDDYLKKNLGSSYISVINTDSYPLLSSDNEPYMSDTHHVTKYGADLLVDKLLSDSVAKEFFEQLDSTHVQR